MRSTLSLSREDKPKLIFDQQKGYVLENQNTPFKIPRNVQTFISQVKPEYLGKYGVFLQEHSPFLAQAWYQMAAMSGVNVNNLGRLTLEGVPNNLDKQLIAKEFGETVDRLSLDSLSKLERNVESQNKFITLERTTSLVPLSLESQPISLERTKTEVFNWTDADDDVSKSSRSGYDDASAGMAKVTEHLQLNQIAKTEILAQNVMNTLASAKPPMYHTLYPQQTIYPEYYQGGEEGEALPPTITYEEESEQRGRVKVESSPQPTRVPIASPLRARSSTEVYEPEDIDVDVPAPARSETVEFQEYMRQQQQNIEHLRSLTVTLSNQYAEQLQTVQRSKEEIEMKSKIEIAQLTANAEAAISQARSQTEALVRQQTSAQLGIEKEQTQKVFEGAMENFKQSQYELQQQTPQVIHMVQEAEDIKDKINDPSTSEVAKQDLQKGYDALLKRVESLTWDKTWLEKSRDIITAGREKKREEKYYYRDLAGTAERESAALEKKLKELKSEYDVLRQQTTEETEKGKELVDTLLVSRLCGCFHRGFLIKHT